MPGVKETAAGDRELESPAAELPDVDARGRKSGMSIDETVKFGCIGAFGAFAICAIVFGSLFIGIGW